MPCVPNPDNREIKYSALSQSAAWQGWEWKMQYVVLKKTPPNMILISFWARHTKRTQKWTMAALTLDLNFPFDALVQVDGSFDSKWFSFWFLYCFQLFLCRCALSPSFPGIPGRLGSRSLYRPQVPNINQPLFSKTNQPSGVDRPITVFSKPRKINMLLWLLSTLFICRPFTSI